ncbi:hypothetical protein [Streptomyces syringium]|uniref:hypothetical protein n=1 Tax=Streptomyces syringium TaxID=76729 RepID=UPI0037CCF1D0
MSKKDEEVQGVLDSIDALGENGDAIDRARRLTQLLVEWPDTHAKVREMRQQAVKELREQGMSLRKIAELLEMSFSRVRQISEGVTNLRDQKRKSEAEQSSEPTE